ncbi:MAG TPA: methyltransferase domain-containing protein [Gammaproteobacteria bacterium]|nr:methyltransferase domain-containing protein [Gammaproteobacteria bacterium]
MSRGAEFALPEPRAARRAFERAAAAFDAASIVHDEARRRLLERLDYVRLEPAVAVDLGCATGRSAEALAARYGSARVLAVDSSLAMLEAARRRTRLVIAGDAERLPLADGSVDLVFANMALPWGRPDRVFAEAARVLTDGGLIAFSTLGPDSLEQVRRAWASVDDRIHVHGLFDMHDLGDLAIAAGLDEPVLDVDRLTLTYKDVESMIRDLRACGAINTAAGRRRTLTGRRRWAGFERALLADRRDGRFSVTIELILGQAFGTGGSRSQKSGSPHEAAVPISQIGRRPRRSRAQREALPVRYNPQTRAHANSARIHAPTFNCHQLVG